MDLTEKQLGFVTYRNIFHMLDAIMYRDIVFNGVCLKPLGLYYMDTGPGWWANRHKHSFFEAHYIVSGTTWTTLNGMEHEINAGELYVMPPGTMHSHMQYNSISHLGFSVRWESGRCNNAEDIRQIWDPREQEELLFGMNAIPTADNGDIYDAMEQLLKAAGKNSKVMELQLSFLKLVLAFASTCSVTGRIMEPAINKSFIESNAVNTAVRFIEENYNQNIEVTDVANSIHLSYSHLSRLFKSYAGKSVNQYINSVRIRKAQYMLKCTDLDIDVIASETGFQSSIYFCSTFKKNTGMSPGQYRKSINGLME